MLFADAALARRLEGTEALSQLDYARTHARLYPQVGSAWMEIPGGAAVFTGHDSPISKVVGLGLAGPVSEGDLDQVEEFYRSRGAAVEIDLCPLAHPSLRELLSRRGYQIKEFGNVLVRQLSPDYAAPEPAPGLSVSLAGPAEAEVWAATISAGFGGSEGPLKMPEGSEPSISLTTFHQPLAQAYLARVEGEPAGGGTLEVRNGVALFYSGSTRVGYRGRGAQTALLQARLAAGAAAGCDIATIQTEPGSGSQRNAQRAGFQIAYTKLALIKR